METEEIASVPFPLFAIVTVSGADATETGVLGKGSDAGLKLTAKNVPSPERFTTCGFPGPLSVNVRVAAALIAVCGVNVRLTTQLAPAASVDVQVFVEMAK